MSIVTSRPSLSSVMPTPPASASREQLSPEIPGMAFSRRSSVSVANGVPQYPRVQESNAIIGVTQPVSAPSSIPNEIQRTPLTMPTPKAQDLPAIQHFTKELFELRNGITSAVDKQNHIVGELRRLNAAYVPSKLSVLSSSETKNETGELLQRYPGFQLIDMRVAMRMRLKEIEKELEMERAKYSEATEQLEIERAKRFEMENILKDVERECESPFVVPALLEAFVKISQATTAAIHYQAPSNANR